MKGIVNSPKQEATKNRDPIRLVTGINSSTNENIVGNIEDEPIPMRATPHHRPASDELAESNKSFVDIMTSSSSLLSLMLM